jgi:hypothetical protein
MATVLYKDQWIAISFDPQTGLVRYSRSEVPYPDLDTVERSFASMRAVVLPINPGRTLLIDVRLAPPRNDAAFEAHINRAIEGVWRRFGKVATLVQTAVGKLQTVRLAHERGVDRPRVFDDEQEALAYLGVAAPPRAR